MRRYIHYILLILYVVCVAAKFVLMGTEKTVTWGSETWGSQYDLTQHYIIPLQIPSLLYCVVILGIYWMHLTRWPTIIGVLSRNKRPKVLLLRPQIL